MRAKTYLWSAGGDSEIEAALAVARDGWNRATLSYRGDKFHRAHDRNRSRLEQAEHDGIIHVMLNSRVVQIYSESVRLTDRSGEVDIPNDFVFILIGGESPEEFLRKTGIEIVEKAVGTFDFS